MKSKLTAPIVKSLFGRLMPTEISKVGTICRSSPKTGLQTSRLLLTQKKKLPNYYIYGPCLEQ